MKLHRLCLPLSLLGLVGGCVTPVPDPVYSTCRGTSAGGWHAWTERMRPRPHDPTHTFLYVRGKVLAPEGMDVSLDLGPVEKLEPRASLIMVRTEGRAAPGAPMVVHEAEGRFQAPRHVQRLRVRCGDGMFALIESVPEGAPAGS